MSLGWWDPAPAVLGAAAAALLLFLRGFVRLRRRGRADHAPWRRAALFAAGLACATAALVSPLDEAGDRYLLSAHMLQHLLVGDAAPALLLVALRGPLLVFVVPAAVLHACSRRPPLRALVRTLGRPGVALGAWALALAAWHVPAAYELALRNRTVHDLEHATLLAAGILVWLQLVDPARRRTLTTGGRLAFAGALLAGGQLLGDVLLLSPHPLYAAYAAQPDRLLGLSPLADQQAAGLLMMAEQMLTLGAFAALSLRAAMFSRPSARGRPSRTRGVSMNRTARITTLALPALLALAALLAAGPSALGAGSAARVTTTTIAVTAGKPSELSFKLSKFSLVKPGKLVFKVTNRGRIVHDFKICTTRTATSAKNACLGKVTQRIQPGKSRTLTVVLLKKGKYEFLCTVPGHAGAGMKGLLGVGVKVAAPKAVATSSPAPRTTSTTTATTTTTTTTTPTTTTTQTNATCNSPASTSVTVAMFDFGYTVTPGSFTCGTVTFNLTNNGAADHDFVIENLIGGASRLLGPGEKASFTVTLAPGTWTYYCSVPTHRALGMEGKLTVTG